MLLSRLLADLSPSCWRQEVTPRHVGTCIFSPAWSRLIANHFPTTHNHSWCAPTHWLPLLNRSCVHVDLPDYKTRHDFFRLREKIVAGFSNLPHAPSTQDCTGQSQTLLKLHMKKENCSRFSNNGQSWPVLISLEVVFYQIIGYVTGPIVEEKGSEQNFPRTGVLLAYHTTVVTVS